MSPKLNQMPPTGDALAEVSEQYARFGLPVIRLSHPLPDGTCSCGRPACWKGERPSTGKHPDMGKAWQKQASTDPATARTMFAGRKMAGIGVVCTHASGLVMLDVDSEYGHELVGKLFGNLPPTPAFRTGRGVRYIFRNASGVKLVERSEKNCDPDTGEELATEAFGVLVGDGVQTVMPPSLHHLGTYYEWLPGRSLEDLPIADAPAELIEYAAEVTKADREAARSPAKGEGDDLPPWTDFNRRGAFLDVLRGDGWTVCHTTGDGVTYLTRPGKGGGVSASLNRIKWDDGTPALFSFSTSVPGIDARKPTDLYGYVTRTRFRGDFAASARALRSGDHDQVRYGERGPPGRPRMPDITPRTSGSPTTAWRSSSARTNTG